MLRRATPRFLDNGKETMLLKRKIQGAARPSISEWEPCWSSNERPADRRLPR